jgi:hypothetical protein
MEEGPINRWKFKYGGFVLHICKILRIGKPVAKDGA